MFLASIHPCLLRLVHHHIQQRFVHFRFPDAILQHIRPLAACSVFLLSLLRSDIHMRVFIASIHMKDFAKRNPTGGCNPPTIHNKPALRVHVLLELNAIEFKLNQFYSFLYIDE